MLALQNSVRNNLQQITQTHSLKLLFRYSEETVHKAVGKLLRSSLKVSNAAIKSGRGIYVYNEYAIKNIFIEDADDFYDVEVKCADFKNQAKTSTGLINE